MELLSRIQAGVHQAERRSLAVRVLLGAASSAGDALGELAGHLALVTLGVGAYAAIDSGDPMFMLAAVLIAFVLCVPRHARRRIAGATAAKTRGDAV